MHLLFLLPPSCMVVPIRDLRNILFQTSALTSDAHNIASVFGDCEMTDVSGVANVIFPDVDCCNKVRGHLLSSSMRNSRSSSLSSDKSTEKYVVRIQQESDNMNQNDPSVSATNSLLVEYETASEQALRISKVADTNTSMRQQCTPTIGPTLNQTVSRSLTMNFIFIFIFIFIFFSIFRITWVRVYQSHGHISHKLMAKSQD